MMTKNSILLSGLFLCLNLAHAENPPTMLSCPDFPYFLPKTGPLAIVNCDFHQHYEKRISQILKTFGTPGGRPIILNLGGTLILKYNAKIQTIDITPAGYQEVKSFAHAALTVFLILSQNPSGTLDSSGHEALITIKTHLESAIELIPTLQVSPESRTQTAELAKATLNLINKIEATPSWTQDAIASEFQTLNPMILHVALIASQIEIQALDSALNPWLAQMGSTDRQRIGIVIATAHQARAKEISIQYFSKKFGHRVGEGALHENGMVVLEGKFDETSALNLLARHYLDREAGNILFHEPARLQRDLLADAAASLLKND